MRSVAIRDLKQVFTRSEVWRQLAFNDTRSKYRLSTLGTIWITMSTAVLVLTIGIIYGQFFGQDMSEYLPYFAVGYIIWTYIASVVNEASTTLVSSSGWIKAANLPIVFYVMRMLHRNLIVLLHNLVIIVLMWIVLALPLSWSALLVIPALLMIHIFLAGASIIISIICVRYRDIPPMIGAITQVFFFATPIIWYPEQLKFGRALIDFNPVGYLLAIARDPLLGRPVSGFDWLVAATIVAVTVAGAAWVYVRYRSRVVYWV